MIVEVFTLNRMITVKHGIIRDFQRIMKECIKKKRKNYNCF